MNKPHKHAQLAMQYAQDMLETETPWERWQFRDTAVGTDWENFLSTGPLWHIDIEYRRKPRVINGIEVPEPMREKPELDTQYFFVTIGVNESVGIARWDDHAIDIRLLELGICHLTREAAELHAKALLSFTKKEETK